MNSHAHTGSLPNTKTNYRTPTLYDTQMKILTTEFYGKIAHDFRRYVFLGLRNGTKDVYEVMTMAASRDGFDGLKPVLYKQEISHLYIRFTSADYAERAIDFFRAVGCFFNAEAVNNILLTWYIIEMTQDRSPTWTTACVDFEGLEYECALAARKAHSILRPFGYSRIPFQKFPASSITVLFMTFAEALAATIALGRWSRQADVIEQSMVYRVRIVSSTKEERLFAICGSTPDEAFGMDYFMPQNLGTDCETTPRYEAPMREFNTPSDNPRRQRRARRGIVSAESLPHDGVVGTIKVKPEDDTTNLCSNVIL